MVPAQARARPMWWEIEGPEEIQFLSLGGRRRTQQQGHVTGAGDKAQLAECLSSMQSPAFDLQCYIN